MRDATFSLAITPPLDREMFSGSVDAGFVHSLPLHHGDLESNCVEISTSGGGGVAAKREALGVVERRTQGVAERRTRGGEMLLTLAEGRRASALRGEEAARFREVLNWRVHHCCGRSAFAVHNLTVDS